MSTNQKRILVLTGAPGVGKTDTAQRLISLCGPKSVWIDTDQLVSIQPFIIDSSFYDLLYSNLAACLTNYARWGASVILVSGVIVPSGIYHQLDKLKLEGYDWRWYGLTASSRILAQRIDNDTKGQDGEQRKLWMHLNTEVKDIPHCYIIRTDQKSVEQVVARIVMREKLFPCKTPTSRSKIIFVPAQTVIEKGVRILCRIGTSPSVARQVVNALLRSELEGYHSHGLLRLKDYAEAATAGNLQVHSRPIIKKITPQLSQVDGRRSWGVLSAQSVARAMTELLEKNSVAIVTLVNSSHLGRLAHIAQSLVSKGIIVLGFANYLGAGQRVPVFGGSIGRLCTNPILIGIPTGKQSPIILDMTTSAVSEGRIRECLLQEKAVSKGWLIDRHWQPVTNPDFLYSSPPKAMIPPLGGALAHKGAGLAFCTEILAGVLTQAGFARKDSLPGGNGGLFIGIRMDSLGKPVQSLNHDLLSLINYCRASSMLPGYGVFRYPGEQSAARYSVGKKLEKVAVLGETWKLLNKLESQIYDL